MHEYLNYLCIEISVLFINSFTLKVKTKFFFMYVMVQRKFLTPSTENLVNAVLFPQMVTASTCIQVLEIG